ncbi:MAG: aminoglycoside phosphotransferase family protein [Actinomycetaceae bacterium]|nr:aminoglycoside phosphotransferase family protein [Actinomycetaceae bacterium]
MHNSTRARSEQNLATLLTGGHAQEILRVAYAGRAQVRSWALHAVHHRPGAGVTAGYSVIFDADPADGRGSDRYVLVSSAKLNEQRLVADGGVSLQWDTHRIHVWEHPYDPELPALRLGCDPNALSQKLAEHVEIELLAYRPTRRAVLRIDRGDTTQYVKIVRPRAYRELLDRFTMLERSPVPTPRLVHSDPAGLLVISGLNGTPLNRIYAALKTTPERSARPILDQLAQTLDGLPLVALGLKPRPAWVDRCEHYGDAAAVALPDQRARIDRLVSGIRELLAKADLGPIVPTHGDFYEANILIDPDTLEVSGLLDVDSLGPGYRVHDWACLLGHLSVLPGLSPKSYSHVPAILQDWRLRVVRWVDPVALGASAAGVTLSLVSGARKSSKPNWQVEAESRLRVAEEWLKFGRESI